MRNLVSIGTFSKVCRLSVRVLRHYDELGLLRPVVDDVSGYRYYTLAQAAEANLIRRLRELDMPLEDIGRILRTTSPDQARLVLELHAGRIAERMAADQRILVDLQRLLCQEEGIMPYEVSIKELAPQPVMGVRMKSSMATLSQDIGQAYAEIFGLLARGGGECVGPPMAVYYGPEFSDDNVDFEAAVPVRVLIPDTGRVAGHVMEGGPAAYTLHPGSYSGLPAAYQAVMEHIQQNGLRPGDACREVYLTNPAEIKDESEHRTEIIWPVEK